MHSLTKPDNLVFAFTFHTQNIDCKRSCQCGQSRACCRICRRYKSDNKQNSDNYRKISLCRNHRKQFVTLLWSLNAVYLGIYIQKNAQHQKQGYYEKLRNTASYHIFLRILEVLATQISLHHVLVETIHGNHRKDPCQELFKEISLIVHIVKIKHARHIRLVYRLP